mmetsp:Transcript_5459/g.15797  ORF Transcript_5459/g.15797 Transcript_5459/m.15797 type:complete len:294 (+) Transcript_5459:558-1439(+)
MSATYTGSATRGKIYLDSCERKTQTVATSPIDKQNSTAVRPPVLSSAIRQSASISAPGQKTSTIASTASSRSLTAAQPPRRRIVCRRNSPKSAVRTVNEVAVPARSTSTPVLSAQTALKSHHSACRWRSSAVRRRGCIDSGSWPWQETYASSELPAGCSLPDSPMPVHDRIDHFSTTLVACRACRCRQRTAAVSASTRASTLARLPGAPSSPVTSPRTASRSAERLASGGGGSGSRARTSSCSGPQTMPASTLRESSEGASQGSPSSAGGRAPGPRSSEEFSVRDKAWAPRAA